MKETNIVASWLDLSQPVEDCLPGVTYGVIGGEHRVHGAAVAIRSKKQQLPPFEYRQGAGCR